MTDPDTALHRSAGSPAAAAAWTRGHRIGSFELLEALSRSASGLVYRAWDHALKRPVAVKEYFPSAWVDRAPDGSIRPSENEHAERFQRGREGVVRAWQTLAQADHPALVRVLHVLEAHGTVYGVMPWHHGGTLLELSRAKQLPLAEPALRRLLDDLLGAVEQIHRADAAHAAIAPDRVMWLDEGRAVLLGPRADAADHGTDLAAAQAGDVQAIATVARFAITGVLPSAAGPGIPEPLALAVERVTFDRLSSRYGADLIAALDSALGDDAAARPQTLAQFRARLAGVTIAAAPRSATPGADVHAATPPTASPIAAHAASQTRPHSAAPATSPSAAAAAAPLSTKAPPGRAHPAGPDDVDPATVDLIRRMLATIPDAEPAEVDRTGGMANAPTFEPAETIDAIDPTFHAGADAREPLFYSLPGVQADERPEGPAPRRARKHRRTAAAWGWGIAAVLLVGAVVGLSWTPLFGERPRVTARNDALPLLPDEPTRAGTPRPRALESEPAPAATDVAPTRSTGVVRPVDPAEATLPPEAPSAAPPAPAAPEITPAPAPVAAPPAATVPPSRAPTPAAATPPRSTPPPARTAAAAPARTAAASPREVCGARTQFSLYRCMQQQCEQAQWLRHAQCLRLRATDSVDD